MLVHLIQAILNFGPKFYVFKCPQSMNTVYGGMVYQQSHTRSVCGFPEGKLRTIRDLSKGWLRTLHEVGKSYVVPKNNFFI